MTDLAEIRAQALAAADPVAGFVLTPRQVATLTADVDVDDRPRPPVWQPTAPMMLGAPVLVRDDHDDTPVPDGYVDLRPSTALRRQWAGILMRAAAADRAEAARHLAAYAHTLDPMYRTAHHRALRAAQTAHAQALTLHR